MTDVSDDLDENFLDHSSTDHSEDAPTISKELMNLSNPNSANQWNSPYNFIDYLQLYEQIYKLYSQGEQSQWRSLFQEAIQKSSNPYQLLYMFLDHTVQSSNSKKHKLVVPLIDQFNQISLEKKPIEFPDQIKLNILAKICRRCVFSQLESIINVFQLYSLANRYLVRHFVEQQLDEHQDLIFISHLSKILRLFESDAIPLEKIVVPLALRAQWETIRFVVGDEKRLQRKLLEIIDQLISTDKEVVRTLLNQCAMTNHLTTIDTHSLKRAARKLLKQYQLSFHDFPNFARSEKISFVKTLFVRKYLDQRGNFNEEDEKVWNEQVKELIQDHHDLQVKLVDLFVDYMDMDAAVQWAEFYHLDDVDTPTQVCLRRQELLQGTSQPQSVTNPPFSRLKTPADETHYHPTVNSSDIVYIEIDSDVDPFLHRLECSRCDVGSHLPFVGFDCETFMDPTQQMLNTQIVSILQLAAYHSSRQVNFYGIFDMLALRLQLDLKSLAEFAQRVFCSEDFILLTYNYAGDTSSLIENYPSMSDALMQGTAIVDLFQIQQYILQHHPQVFPYYGEETTGKARGLSELVRLCFGKPLDKSLQISDWRKRPLKQAQLIYSVLDARVLVDIALLIEERTKLLNISWSWSDFKGYTWTNKAFKKRTSHNHLPMP